LDSAIYFDEVEKINLSDIENMYYEFHDHDRIVKLISKIESSVTNRYTTKSNYLSSRLDLSNLIFEMRLIKSSHEIDQIKHAASVSAKAHINLMQTCKPNLKEYQIESDFIKICMDNACNQAYPAIVASGKNGTVLHYTNNNSNLKADDLLLVDAAAEYGNYASDITRTIPISGKFNQYQKLIYNIVLKAQTMAIKSCLVNQTLVNIHRIAVRYIVKGLLEAKILRGTLEKNIKSEKYKKFYMHNTGHWLGLDVHDPCPYVVNGEPVKLKPGMIFTVEPGIYISKDSGVDDKFQNIAIRIEDDVLITKNGPIVLSNAVPKTVTAIETLMAHG
jgi:Xaa-Pro aminopeptidase